MRPDRLPHRTEPIGRAAISLLHSLAMILPVMIPPFFPGPALLAEMHLGRLAAFAVVDGASAVVGADTAAVDAVTQGLPLSEELTVTVPFWDPLRRYVPLSRGTGGCAASTGLLGLIARQVLWRDHTAGCRIGI